VVKTPVGHCVVHPEATVDGPERYRSRDANDRDMLAVRAADAVDGAERTDAVGNQERAQTVQPRITIRRVGRVQLAAVADSFQRTRVLELLQELEIVVAWNAEQVPDAGFLETAKQKVADIHSLAYGVGHRLPPAPIGCFDVYREPLHFRI
jgi:hypothetical protein